METFYKEHPINAGIPRDSMLSPTLFLPQISDLPDDDICNIVIYADNTTFYWKCNQEFDL